MIAVDTNILVAFMRAEYVTHEIAFERIRGLAEGARPWALPWPCIHEFLAIVTNGRIFKKPCPVADAFDAIEALVESPSVRLIGESTAYLPVLRKLLASGRITGGQVHDARIAAICLAHGVEVLWTADRDFSYFPSLKTENPFAG